jgi:hypothetical protein
MKCTICGTESKVDARFCSGCGATLILPKTDETMLDLRTAMYRRPVIVPAAPPAPAATSVASPNPPVGNTAAGPPPAATARATPKPGTGTGARVLVLIAVGIVGYFVYQVATTLGPSWIAAFSETSAPPVKSAEPPRSPPPATGKGVAEPTPSEVASPAPLPPMRPAMSEAAPPAALAPKVTAPPAPVAPKKSSAPSGAKPASPGKSAAAAPRRTAPKAPLTSPPTSPDPEPLPLPAPVTAAAPAPQPQPAPPQPDRWQEMSDALARCGQESFIGRVVCEQRVRFRYCDGYWGRVAQCPDAQNPNPGR